MGVCLPVSTVEESRPYTSPGSWEELSWLPRLTPGTPLLFTDSPPCALTHSGKSQRVHSYSLYPGCAFLRRAPRVAPLHFALYEAVLWASKNGLLRVGGRCRVLGSGGVGRGGA